MATVPTFDLTAPTEPRPCEVLVLGLSNLGLGGLTAADYLVRQLDSEAIGAMVPEGLPAIAPFEAGVPRHPTRLYTLDDTSLAVLVGELFIPPALALEFVRTLLAWAVEAGVEEVVVLHGVPFPHDPEGHAVYYVATGSFRERRLDGSALQPLAGGVLDGVPGELLTRNLDDGLPVGVLVTPTHPPGPDVDAAIRLIEALEGCYDLDVDEAELVALSEQLQRYYEELADRMSNLGEGDQPVASRDFPDDRMYM